MRVNFWLNINKTTLFKTRILISINLLSVHKIDLYLTGKVHSDNEVDIIAIDRTNTCIILLSIKNTT